MFEQVHSPGEAIQSDFTHAADRAGRLRGAPFPHLLFHEPAHLLQRRGRECVLL
jgi:hypothetical protein